ncbi:hypothetical protein CMI40_02595 [Candidatus Pacearchaeota archaeon]|nr:hypothetical protein [Candidatus Pacearchaeota archaeon]|tara:strand:+ start:7554 stop:8279 length:726 start_codon:yes stop_codon:yes gene_type:complete
MIKKYIFYYGFLIFLISITFVSGEEDCFPEFECGKWSECEDEIQKRTCIDKKCGVQEIIERKFCPGFECNPDIKCGNWSNCNFEEKIKDILNEELTFKGYKDRSCIDLNGCVSESIEEESCSLSAPIKVKKTKWCNEEYVEVYDIDTNKLVSRIKQEKIPNFSGLSRVDVSFLITKSSVYCNYCFNGIKDYDEERIDCGGSCSECITKIEFFNWLPFIITSLWIIFSLLLIVFLVGERRIY